MKGTYTHKGKTIFAKYDLDVSYYRFVMRLENCTTERERRSVLDVPYQERERGKYFYSEKIIGVDVFNAFVADFLCHFPDFVPAYKKGFKKGKKHFNKAYRVKMPTLDQIKAISDIYNNELKPNIACIPHVFCADNIERAGFENGKLAGYSDFENDYKAQFEALRPQQPPQPQPQGDGWLKVGIKFADGTIKNDQHRPSYTKVTTNAGLPASLRPYVSATLGNNRNEKNIFRSPHKMQAIHDYCVKNNISVCDWFLDRYNDLKALG